MPFFKSGLLLQQPIAPLEGVAAHFSNMYCFILKEMRGREIFDLPGQTSQQLQDPFSSDSVVEQKWRCFGAIVEISSGHKTSRINSNQISFRRSISNKNQIRFGEKNVWGFRCTLVNRSLISQTDRQTDRQSGKYSVRQLVSQLVLDLTLCGRRNYLPWEDKVFLSHLQFGFHVVLFSMTQKKTHRFPKPFHAITCRCKLLPGKLPMNSQLLVAF